MEFTANLVSLHLDLNWTIHHRRFRTGGTIGKSTPFLHVCTAGTGDDRSSYSVVPGGSVSAPTSE